MVLIYNLKHHQFINDKITEEERNNQLIDISIKITGLEEDQVKADNYLRNREQIIDDAMTFISAPDIFWNRANLQIKQDI